MAAQIVIAPLLIALLTAIATLPLRRFPRAQRAASVLGALAYLGAVALLAGRVVDESILVYQLSAWPSPFGITLVADALSLFMLGLTAIVSLASVAFSVRFMSGFAQRISYHTLYHLMVVGITGSFLTGDIFNLFVWFEVMLLSSYVLVAFYSGPEHTRAALTYTVLNLLGSALMLLAIGGLYATVGTLNMADMARRLANPAQFGVDPVPVLGLTVLLFCVFALKAGIVPFQFWVPAAYRAAPAPVTAMLAGVVKKVGIYAIIRLYFTVFAAATLPAGLGLPGFVGNDFLSFFGPILFVMAAGSILLGGIGAVSRDGLDGVLAYSSIGQIGFVILPLAVAATVPEVRALAIAAALVYALNHGLTKSMLFLASGTVKEAVGSVRFERIGGLAKRTPVLSIGFFLGAVSLIGIPPLSGFFGKLLVFRTTAHAGALGGRGGAVALGLSLIGAILTIAYFSRAWNRGFWGTESEGVRTATYAPSLVVIVVGLAGLLLLVGVGFDPVLRAAEAAADIALDRQAYVDAVLEGLQ
ncbi:complex I subunit 5 family protein [Halococcus qingdaonensis]|uniref:complex I subunit 5 family protein n=1 Tax=Halococcus qingdaonensis TaxID=224402 RepID=UPI002116062C|nr:proton-conducting transporter membrane subunit [Halococcus qingdaonensis]